MVADMEDEVEVSLGAASRIGFSLPREAQPEAVASAHRNFHGHGGRLLSHARAIARSAGLLGPLPAAPALRTRGDRHHPSVAPLLNPTRLAGTVALGASGHAAAFRTRSVAGG